MHDSSNDSGGSTASSASNNQLGLLAKLNSVGGDLKDPRWIYAKGILFLGSGILAASLLLLEHPTWKDAMLLALTVWCFCRFYYFAFYVIEHYVDGEFKFAGLWSFAKYLLNRKSSGTVKKSEFRAN